MYIRILLIIAIHFVSYINAFSQEPYMWHISDDDGLPSNEVYQIFQDRKGYIWMGTDNGVAKFDGHHFKVLTCDGQQGRAISYFNEDSKGRIWCINFSGQIFWIENDSLHLLKEWNKYQKSHFPTLSIDNNDNLWILSFGNPLIKYNSNNRQFEEIKAGGIGPNSITNVFCKNNNIYIIDRLDGAKILKNKQFQTIPIVKPNNEKLVVSNFEYSEQPSGDIYIFKKTQKIVYTLNNNHFEEHKINKYLNQHQSGIINIAAFKNGEIYVPTYSGLLYFKDANCQPTTLLKGEQVSFVKKDIEGNLWISTLKNGVYVMPNNKLFVINSQNSKLHNSTPAFLATNAKGDIFCSHNNGYISIINSENGQVKKVIDVGIRKDCEMLQYDVVSGKLFTTYDSLLEISDEGSIKGVIYRTFNIKGISLGSGQNYILADPTSLYITNKKQNKILSGDYLSNDWLRNFKWNSTDDTSKPNARYRLLLNNQRTRTLYHDAANKTIWVSFTNGIYYFKNGTKHQLLDESGKEIVAYKFAAGIDGTIWAGTANHGLICIKNDKIILHLTTKDGLLSNFIKSLSTSEKGVWFFAETGIQFYQYKNKSISSFTRADGLISNDITDVLTTGKKVWICTSKGIQFFPDDFGLNSTTQPLVYITGLAIAEYDTILKDYMSLNYNQNNIRIAINGLSYNSRGHFKYKYRLLGLDSNWITIDSRNTYARFPSLPSGVYTFEVVSMNED